MKRRVLLLAVAVMMTITPAPAQFETPVTWTNYQATDSNNAVFPGTLKVAWAFDTGGKINGSLAISGDTIYVDSFSKKVFALDLKTGRKRWEATVPRIVMSTPIVADGLVIVGTGTNQVLTDSGATTIWGNPAGDDVIALRQSDGTVVWTYHTVGEDMPTPAVVGTNLIFSNGDMHAYALNIKTGKLLWKTALPGITTMSATATGDGRAFVIASRGLDYIFSNNATHMIALDPKTGAIAWSAHYGNSDCSPTVADHLVMCEGSSYLWYGVRGLGWMGRNDVEAYDMRTGHRAWRWVGDPGYFTMLGSSERGIAGMVHGGILYQSIPTLDEMGAFRLTDGKLLWTFRSAGSVKMSPLYWDGFLIFGDTEGLLYAVDATTGQINNIVAKKLPFTTSAPVIVGETLFIANGTHLYAIPLDSLVLR